MLNGSFHFFAHNPLAVTLAFLPITAHVFWTYFSAIVLLAVGLAIICRNELAQRRGLEKLLPFGRLFYAIPMAVFGADHLTDASNVARVVPSWMPAHLFWTYLVGVALVAAALSIVVKRYARLAAILLGSMLLLFVVMMHIPNLVAQPNDRVLWVTTVRDLVFSVVAFIFAGSQMWPGLAGGKPWLVTIGRIIIAGAAFFFGVEELLNPAIAPGVPLDLVTPAWVLGHLFWAYLGGVVLVACGACILLNMKARLAAMCLGIMVLLLVLFVYLPILFAKLSDVDNGLNYIVDTLGFSGVALILADAMRERTSHTPSA